MSSQFTNDPKTIVDEMVIILQELGTNTLQRQDVYAFIMGDLKALDAYKGDVRDDKL